MRYIQPQITGSLNAVSTIQGVKAQPAGESGPLTIATAYAADE